MPFLKYTDDILCFTWKYPPLRTNAAFSSLPISLGFPADSPGLCSIFVLNFFAGYQVSDAVPNTFSLGSYISLFMSMVLIFGIVFEFPTLVAVLSALGVIDRDALKSLRRYAICIVLVLAAIITPSGDPFSLLVVSVPLYLL